MGVPKGGVMLTRDLRSLADRIKRRLTFYKAIWADPDTPASSRLLLGVALGYLALPFDLIPDWIPLIGHLDDLVIVPGLIWLALRSVPEEVVEKHRPLLEQDLTPGQDRLE